VWLACLAVLLCLPSLWAGLGIDDWWHRLVLLGRHPVSSPTPWSIGLFRFIDGDPEHTRALMDLGVLPWWTWPELKAAFVRPLAELTHRLDYGLWPNSPWLMHVHSLSWFGLAIGLAAVLYRRVMGPGWVAGLAALLYAVDDSHGPVAGWIASRNSLMALCFGIATAIAHVSWRRDGKTSHAVAGAGCLLLGLLSSEAALGITAYLFAYALTLDRGSLGRRMSSLLPYVATTAAWWVLNRHLGYGVEGSEVYVDPLTHPLRFFAAVIDGAPILLLSQWATPPASLHMFMPPSAVAGLQIAGVLVSAVLAWAMLRLWRTEPLARFWTLGMLLSLLPICATFPHERLLLFVGLGAMGLLALWLERGFRGGAPRRAGDWRRAAGAPATERGQWLRWPLIAVHGVLAPLTLPLTTLETTMVSRMMVADSDSLPQTQEVPSQTWVFVSSSVPFLQGYVPVIRKVHDQPAPAQVRTLAPSNSGLRISRTDPRTLVIRAQQGYLTAPLDGLFRDGQHPMRPGQIVRLAGLSVQVLAMTVDDRPLEASFRFDQPLEHSKLAWFVHQDGGIASFSPPSIGETVILPPEPPMPLDRLLQP